MSASRFDFRPRALPGANERWRDLDRTVARWVLAHGGAPALAQAAAWASLADGQGDVALMLEPGHAARLGAPDIGHLAADLRALAQDAPRWIGTPAGADSNAPFVLDGDAFYLRRNFLHERAVA
ncbi:MAG: exodeoxyribonuclease V subunit alpha, partial [Lysobacteraceae bacterium]